MSLEWLATLLEALELGLRPIGLGSGALGGDGVADGSRPRLPLFPLRVCAQVSRSFRRLEPDTWWLIVAF
jgi:hypothetical protein